MESLGLLLVIASVSFSGVDCSNLGQNNCLASRLEHVPCQYRLPQQTKQPGKNELGDYYTTFSNGRCDILNRRHKVEPVPKWSLPGGSLIFSLYSPGKRYTRPRNYRNKKLVYYNIDCPAGQYIYFELFDMNLENTKCYDSSVGRSKCVDYVQVRTPEGNTIADNCGIDKSDLNGVILPLSSIQVIFRSSVRSTYSGFFAIAQCFSHISTSSSRCLKPNPSINKNHRCQGSGFEKIEIPYGHELTVQDSTAYSKLSLRNRMTGVVQRFTKRSFSSLDFRRMDGTTEHFEKIKSTLDRHTLNLEERIQGQHEFYRSSLTPSIPSVLKGPGIFYVPKNRNGQACFQNYLVDVSKYVPTQSEKETIRKFSKALDKLIDRVEPPDDDELTDEVDVEPVDVIRPYNPIRIPTYPRDRIILPYIPSDKLALQKRSSQSSQKINRIDQSTLFSAVKNNGACNPIVRGSASIISKTLQKENPSQFRTLQERALQLDEHLLQNSRLDEQLLQNSRLDEQLLQNSRLDQQSIHK